MTSYDERGIAFTDDTWPPSKRQRAAESIGGDLLGRMQFGCRDDGPRERAGEASAP